MENVDPSLIIPPVARHFAHPRLVFGADIILFHLIRAKVKYFGGDMKFLELALTEALECSWVYGFANRDTGGSWASI